MTAAALDEGRSGNLQRQIALLHHIYVVLESASWDPSHKTEWRWPVLGIQDPEGPCLALWAPAEQSAVVAYHNRRVALDAGSPRLPDFSKNSLPGGWEVFLLCLKDLEERSRSPPSFAPACHECDRPMPSNSSDPDSQQQVPPTSATFRGQKRH